MGSEAKGPRRSKHDRTFYSVCPKCSLSVYRGPDKSKQKQCETCHVCDPKPPQSEGILSALFRQDRAPKRKQ